MNQLPPEVTATWIALITTSRVLLERVEAALKAADLPMLSWYDALLEIEKAGEDGLRPFVLKQRLLLPQYGTSRLIDRIAVAGLIEKVDCADDGRGFLVRITPEGRRVRRMMWPIYSAQLSELLQSQLSGEDLETLGNLLARIRPR